MYSPAKHHWGVVVWERRVGGGRLSFSKPALEEEEEEGVVGFGMEGGKERGRGESLTSCSPPSHKRSAEPQRRAGRSRK